MHSGAGAQDDAPAEKRSERRNTDLGARRPSVQPPLSPAYKRSFDQNVVVLEPTLPPTPHSDWSRIYVYTGGAVQAVRAADGSIAWGDPADQDIRPELLLATREHALFATKHEVFALDAEDGRRRWTVGQRPSALNRPDTDPERFVEVYAPVYHEGRVYVLREDGRAACVGVSTGRAVWERKLDCRPAGRLAVSDRWLVFRGEGNGGHRYYVIEAATGGVESSIEVDERVTDLRVRLTPDERLLIVRSRSVRCIDPAEGSGLWQFDADGYIIDASLAFDREVIYLSDDGRHLKRLRLEDGAVSWTSRVAFPFKIERARVVLAPDAVLVLSESAVTALSPADGRRLWSTATDPARPFRDHFRGDQYLVSVARSIGNRRGRYGLYFTRIAGRSDGARRATPPIDIGAFEELPHMVLRDDAFVLLTGRELIGWVHKGDE
jgi:outer membrane protein assembly factor BamB